jgi:hypothetical protein
VAKNGVSGGASKSAWRHQRRRKAAYGAENGEMSVKMAGNKRTRNSAYHRRREWRRRMAYRISVAAAEKKLA